MKASCRALTGALVLVGFSFVLAPPACAAGLLVSDTEQLTISPSGDAQYVRTVGFGLDADSVDVPCRLQANIPDDARLLFPSPDKPFKVKTIAGDILEVPWKLEETKGSRLLLFDVPAIKRVEAGSSSPGTTTSCGGCGSCDLSCGGACYLELSWGLSLPRDLVPSTESAVSRISAAASGRSLSFTLDVRGLTNPTFGLRLPAQASGPIAVASHPEWLKQRTYPMGLILEGGVPQDVSAFEIVLPDPATRKGQAYLAGEIPNQLFPPPMITSKPTSEIKRRHVTRIRLIQEINLSKD